MVLANGVGSLAATRACTECRDRRAGQHAGPGDHLADVQLPRGDGADGQRCSRNASRDGCGSGSSRAGVVVVGARAGGNRVRTDRCHARSECASERECGRTGKSSGLGRDRLDDDVVRVRSGDCCGSDRLVLVNQVGSSPTGTGAEGCDFGTRQDHTRLLDSTGQYLSDRQRPGRHRGD